MKKNTTLFVLGIFLITIFLFINNEVYQHRLYMKKAKEAIAGNQYDYATAYLQKANTFPFHKQVETYISIVEKKKQQNIMAYINNTQEKSRTFKAYKAWIESEIFTPISMAFEKNNGKEGVSPLPMKNLFYQLNFEVENKRIYLNKEYEEMHNYLSEYIQKNQIAYSYWEQKKPTEAEKVRQEAIAAHTNFLIALNDYVKKNGGNDVELLPHRY